LVREPNPRGQWKEFYVLRGGKQIVWRGSVRGWVEKGGEGRNMVTGERISTGQEDERVRSQNSR